MISIPHPLSKGDSISVIAPAGNIHDPARYHRGCSILEEMGFEIYQKVNTWPGTGFLSDSDDGRAREFMSAWANPEIRAIFTLRGGYGALRILEKIDLDIVRNNPKLFIGFSDITILLNHIAHHTSTVCLHGPVVSSLASSDRLSIDRLYSCLCGNWLGRLKENVEVIRSTPAVSGILMGGNLSSLATLLGTKWDISYKDCILLLEDINEPHYRLDRLLTQLFLGNKFDGVKGIILGDFSNKTAANHIDQLRTQEFVWQRMLELVPNSEIPIWGNFPAGHSTQNMTLPIGSRCTMDCSRGLLTFQAH